MEDNTMYKKVKWIQSKVSGKHIPCEPNITRFIVNPHSPTMYYTPTGEAFHGIEHPNGSLFGYRTKPRNFFEK